MDPRLLLLAIVPLCLLISAWASDILATPEHYFNYLDPSRGAYQFGYDTGPSLHQSFREETRTEDGGVRGRYGYVESDVLRVTEYVADHLGYRCRETVRYLVRPDRDPGQRANSRQVRGGKTWAPKPARVMGKKVVGRYKDFTSEPAVGGTAAVSRWDSAHGPAAELREEELWQYRVN